MPAVDYRLPDGLQWDELSAVLKVLMASSQAVWNKHWHFQSAS